jgi:hypothetical protein
MLAPRRAGPELTAFVYSGREPEEPAFDRCRST